MSLPTVEPNVEKGIEYWNTQPATYNGVLGGYGNGSLPRIDSLGSRLFLLNLFPGLSTVPSAFRPLDSDTPAPADPPRTRALDVGAGVGRVTKDVLLHLVSDVTLLEPVEPFVQEALSKARSSTDPSFPGAWRGLADASKSVTVLQGTLQDFHPLKPHHARFLDRIGYQPPRPGDEIGLGFDVIWCQWCLGHLSDVDLVDFFKRSKESLKNHPKAVIVVKENICPDSPEGLPIEVFDEQDSSLTRSDLAWKSIFKQAGLRLIREQVQDGLPQELYVVKMYGLR